MNGELLPGVQFRSILRLAKGNSGCREITGADGQTYLQDGGGTYIDNGFAGRTRVPGSSPCEVTSREEYTRADAARAAENAAKRSGR